MTKSEELFKRAVNVIPGGVNSPVRAYGSVGETPRFIQRANGSKIFDVDGNEYIDFIDSCSLMSHYGKKLGLVQGPMENIKITTPSDFFVLRAMIEVRENQQIFGF